MAVLNKKKYTVFLSTWSFLRNVGYLLVIFLLAAFIFNGPDQSRDFMMAFRDGSEPSYYISVAILLFFWSYITWYSASIILQISPVNYEHINETLAERFCYVIGAVPALLMAITFFFADAIVHGIACLLLGLFCVLFFKWRDKRNSGKCEWPERGDIARHNTNDRGEEITPSFMDEIRFIARFPNVIFYFRTIGIFFILMLIVLCFSSPLIWITRSLRPASVVILALTFFTYVATVLYYFHDIKARPFVLFIIIWVIFCSRWNDNTKIPIMKRFNASADFRLTPQAAFDKWYDRKLTQWADSTHSDSMPVIFIATQGGGIRGEVWTSEVLHKLEEEFPGFYNQVFCIGGASGGTVGALYYNSFVFDSINNKKNNPAIGFNNFQKFTQADCISPVTASFAFGETVQRLLPLRIPALERSKIMMQAFERSYQIHLKSSLAGASMLSMHYPNDDSSRFNCDLPSVFINGVLAETGQRVITSNLKINGSINFEHDIDFFDRVRGHVSISTASLNCMRFPLLLSGGLFDRVKGKDTTYYSVGHIVDGGYRENTGLQAMYSLMCELKDRFKGKPIKPILLYLRNGGLEYEPQKADTTNAMRWLQDIGIPFRSLINVNGTSVPSLGIMTMIRQQQANDNPLNMYYSELWLKDNRYPDDESFPLGLYISDSAYGRLLKRAQLVTEVNTAFSDTLRKYFER